MITSLSSSRVRPAPSGPSPVLLRSGNGKGTASWPRRAWDDEVQARACRAGCASSASTSGSSRASHCPLGPTRRPSRRRAGPRILRPRYRPSGAASGVLRPTQTTTAARWSAARRRCSASARHHPQRATVPRWTWWVQRAIGARRLTRVTIDARHRRIERDAGAQPCLHHFGAPPAARLSRVARPLEPNWNLRRWRMHLVAAHAVDQIEALHTLARPDWRLCIAARGAAPVRPTRWPCSPPSCATLRFHFRTVQ